MQRIDDMKTSIIISYVGAGKSNVKYVEKIQTAVLATMLRVNHVL